MLEVHSLRVAGRAPAETRLAAPEPSEAPQTFVGEIVDTKCYLGAMKPGRGKPHRDCASLCIRGGIPAALLVRTENGERRLVHLLDERGQPMGTEVLDWVGQPVAVSGILRRKDDRLFLKVPTTEWIRAATGVGS